MIVRFVGAVSPFNFKRNWPGSRPSVNPWNGIDRRFNRCLIGSYVQGGSKCGIEPRSLYGENGSVIRAVNPEFRYSAHDLRVKVKELPPQGSVIRQDGATIHLGHTLSATELAGLSFRQAINGFDLGSRPPIERRSNGSTLYVAQNASPTPIQIDASEGVEPRSAALHVIITELPSNGTVLLSDRTTVVTALHILTGRS